MPRGISEGEGMRALDGSQKSRDHPQARETLSFSRPSARAARGARDGAHRPLT